MIGTRSLVSAVVPVYNGQEYVADAIASVLSQTYQPLECIVVDDGSSDATSDVVRRFGDHVHYTRQDRRGVAAARNTGAQLARGEFVAFLDADDSWETSKLERQMELLRRRPRLGLVYCGLRRVAHDGHPLDAVAAPDPRDVLRNILLQRGPGPSIAQTGLLPRAALAAAGGFDEHLSIAADSDLAWRIAARFEVAAVAEPLASYRLHPAQMHRDLRGYEHDVGILLSKAFASGWLPPALQRLERRAHANVSLTLAYMYRSDRRRAWRELWKAARLSPPTCATALTSAAARRVTRRTRA